MNIKEKLFKNQKTTHFGVSEALAELTFEAQTAEEKKNSLENLHNLMECAKIEEKHQQKSTQTKHFLITELVEKEMDKENIEVEGRKVRVKRGVLMGKVWKTVVHLVKLPIPGKF